MIPQESHRGKNQSRQIIVTVNCQVYWRRGSVLNWLKLSWFGTSLDWFTRPTELKSRNAYLLYSTLQEVLHASELQVNFRS